MIWLEEIWNIKRTASNRVLLDKAFNSAKNLKYDWCQHGLASVVYKFVDKKSGGTSTHTGTGIN